MRPLDSIVQSVQAAAQWVRQQVPAIFILLSNALNPHATSRNLEYRRGNIFGANPAAVLSKYAKINGLVPDLVLECIAELDAKGLRTEGLFRVPGTHTVINRMRADIESGKSLSQTPPHNEHDVASVLKMYFRELPSPLFGDIETVNQLAQKNELEAFKEHIRRLPEVNRELMKALFGLLNRVQQQSKFNLMTTKNLALIFSATLNCSFVTIIFVINHYTYLLQES
ncbi:hypothetical protein PROFUN_06370 [Planoprotostelium fungivorum]|uniref:Rho-GAP domain-containing protein n=1 Tax=Planoprotostelium fungivorum TaxID=1890364 RepID=A0A2P6NNP6_9EUKA|nr:hypothetical protein PROFUN_06370 [Planoprotostelium fungivorum]